MDLTLIKKIDKKVRFLKCFRETLNIGRSARYAGVRRETVWHWRKNNSLFAQQYEMAKAEAIEALEDEMHRRAFQGILRQSKDGEYRVYSDRLAIFLLKAHAPWKYNDKIRTNLNYKFGNSNPLTDAEILQGLHRVVANLISCPPEQK